MKKINWMHWLLPCLVAGLLLMPGCDNPSGPDTTSNTQHIVTFESNGGSTVQPQTVNHGGKAAEPEGVTKEDHTLAGWYRDDNTFENKWDFETDTVTVPITLYAKWNEIPSNSHVVTFVSNGGSHVEYQIVTNGEKATEPEDVTKEDHTLAGWYQDDNTFENKWDFDTDTVTGDITLYAKWEQTFTVTFTGNGEPVVVPVLAGNPVAQPPSPAANEERTLTAEEMKTVANGQAGLYALSAAFQGWFDGDNAWDFATIVSANITLTANWNHRQSLTADGSLVRNALTGAYINNTNKSFLALLSENQTLTGSGGVINLTNTDLTILAVGNQEITISVAEENNSFGSAFKMYDAELTIGNYITLQGRDNNNGALVYMDGTGDSVDELKTKFTMLPGSKLINNKNLNAGWGDGFAAGIRIEKGVLTVNGAEISGNVLDTNHGYTDFQGVGISLNGDLNIGKVVVEGNSTITNNFFQAINGDRDIIIGGEGNQKGHGALTISGSPAIGNVAMDNTRASIVVAGAFTGSLNIIPGVIQSSGGDLTGPVPGPMIYGTDTYTLTTEDLSHITLPAGKQWGAIQDNAASVVSN